MFGFSRSNKIDKVFKQVNQSEHFSKVKAEKIFQRADIERIFNLSSDVNTTVTLTLLWHQTVFAQRVEAESPYEEVVQSWYDVAAEKESDVKTLIEQEADGYVDSAKFYGNNIADKLESGRIVSNSEVREFCANNAEILLVSWMKYRMKLMSAFDEYQPN